MNIAEILKDCPKGTKLYSPIFGEVNFINIDDVGRIKVNSTRYYRTHTFNFNGTFDEDGECLLFPSKDNRDWSAFKVSEDEKIRKEIIAFITTTPKAINSHEKWIAWLENQGEQKPTLPKWKYKKDHTPLLRDSIILNKYGCVAKSPSGALVSDVWVIDYDELAKLPKEEFENQCEQKLTLEDAAKAFLDALSKTLYNNKPITDAQVITCELLKFLSDGHSYNPNALNEQNPADKVEPKFKVGDWVVYCNEDVDLITGVEETGYIINKGGYIPFVCEDDMHLWTIQDAKDGDVLNSRRVHATIIFKGFNHDCKHIDAYCALQSGIFIHQEMLWDRDFEPTPKVWENKLFEAMKEAGYEWDSEKKELKKIEQEEDTELTDFESALFSAFSDAWQEYLSGKKVNVTKWTREHSAELLEIAREQKPVWSEEDEKKIDLLIAILEVNHPNGQFKVNPINTLNMEAMSTEKIVDWLKSLKERMKGE